MAERATYEQTILQLISTPAPRLSTVVPDIPPALDDLVAEMLEHDLDRRVPDMHAVRERLSAIYPELHGSSVKLRSLPPVSSSSPRTLRRPRQRRPAPRDRPAGPPSSPCIARAQTSALIGRREPRRVLGIGLGLFALRRPARGLPRPSRPPATRHPRGRLPPLPAVSAAALPPAARIRLGTPPRSSSAPAPLADRPRPASRCPPPGLQPRQGRQQERAGGGRGNLF